MTIYSIGAYQVAGSEVPLEDEESSVRVVEGLNEL